MDIVSEPVVPPAGGLALEIGPLLRVGRTLSVVHDELGELDASGIARATTLFNNTLGELGSLFDGEIGAEFSTFFSPIENASARELGVAYAGVTGWLRGLLSGGIMVAGPDEDTPSDSRPGYL